MTERTNRWPGKTVLITGGLGFIGSNLAHRLVEEGAEVVILDAALERYGANAENIAEISDRVSVVKEDVRNAEIIDQYVSAADIVYHFAAQLSRTVSLNDPELDMDINCRGTLNVLRSASDADPSPKVVFASSQAVVGVPDELPIDENTRAAPVDVYGANKRAGEMYFDLYNRVEKVPTTVVRLSNVYGPHAQLSNNEYGVIHQFIRKAIEDEELTVFEPGDMKRDFVFVDDVVDALEKIGRNPSSCGNRYMIGSGSSVTINELATLIVREAKAGSVELVPWPDDWEAIRIGDMETDPSTIEEQLGWTAEVALSEGIGRTLNFYRSKRTHYI